MTTKKLIGYLLIITGWIAGIVLFGIPLISLVGEHAGSPTFVLLGIFLFVVLTISGSYIKHKREEAHNG